jgi:hypothetical protein
MLTAALKIDSTKKAPLQMRRGADIYAIKASTVPSFSSSR